MNHVAALTVLNRIAEGEVLLQHSGNRRVFFNTRRDGIVSSLLAKSMIAADLLTPGPDHGVNGTLIMTAKGARLRDDPVKLLPKIRHPMPTLAWFSRIGESVLGLDDLKLHDLPPTGRCLVWTGPCNTRGDAKTTVASRTIGLARFMYEHTFGPIPAASRLQHDGCQDGRCINPYHHTDSSNQKFVQTTPAAMLGAIRRALVAGDDDLALKIVAGLSSPTSAPPVVDERMDQVIDLVEYLYHRDCPTGWAELWAFAKPRNCTEAEIEEAVKRIGGNIALYCSKPEDK